MGMAILKFGVRTGLLWFASAYFWLAVAARPNTDPVATAIGAELDALMSPDVSTVHGDRIAFGGRLGLEPDASVGGATIAELNVPIAERITQLRVNLDRGRALLHDLPELFEVVNIAGYTIYLVKGQQVALPGVPSICGG